MKAFSPKYKEGTYGYVFELLEHTAEAAYQGEELIDGDPVLARPAGMQRWACLGFSSLSR